MCKFVKLSSPEYAQQLCFVYFQYLFACYLLVTLQAHKTYFNIVEIQYLNVYDMYVFQPCFGGSCYVCGGKDELI